MPYNFTHSLDYYCLSGRRVRSAPHLLGQLYTGRLYSCVIQIIALGHLGQSSGNLRSSCAFTATMIVDNDMSPAPNAGDTTKPNGAVMPAASGMAIAL